jgi:hypothetical protein
MIERPLRQGEDKLAVVLAGLPDEPSGLAPVPEEDGR